MAKNMHPLPDPADQTRTDALADETMVAGRVFQDAAGDGGNSSNGIYFVKPNPTRSSSF
jgi:hypothetical protein